MKRVLFAYFTAAKVTAYSWMLVVLYLEDYTQEPTSRCRCGVPVD